MKSRDLDKEEVIKFVHASPETQNRYLSAVLNKHGFTGLAQLQQSLDAMEQSIPGGSDRYMDRIPVNAASRLVTEFQINEINKYIDKTPVDQNSRLAVASLLIGAGEIKLIAEIINKQIEREQNKKSLGMTPDVNRITDLKSAKENIKEFQSGMQNEVSKRTHTAPGRMQEEPQKEEKGRRFGK